jgi:AcrR family transcriptional regulator
MQIATSDDPGSGAGRSHGHAATRERLLQAAVRVFADRGYAEASTREICRLAGANLAAIHYHFGDKPSLYRAVFRLPEQFVRLPAELDDAGIPPERVLGAFYVHMMRFVVMPEEGRHMRLLMIREQVQPSGVLDAPPQLLRHYHTALLRLLGRWLGVEAAAADAALHQLAFSLVGLAMVIVLERSAVAAIAPQLLDGPGALEDTAARLAAQAADLVAGERRRRAEGRRTGSQGTRGHAR